MGHKSTFRILKEIESKVDAISEHLESSGKLDLLTRKDVMKILSITPATLNRWSKKGTLKRYGICGRVYYKSSELKTMLKEI